MQADKILELIFVTYWSQILLIIGSLGYLIKINFDRKSKLKELKTSILLQKRIQSLELLNTKFCELNILIDDILTSIHTEQENNNDDKINTLDINNKEFIKLFRQVSIFSDDYKHNGYIVDFESKYASFIHLLSVVYTDENAYKTKYNILLTKKKQLEYKFHELIMNYLK